MRKISLKRESHNSSDDTQPHPVIVKYTIHINLFAWSATFIIVFFFFSYALRNKIHATKEMKRKANEMTIIFSHTPSGRQVENPT